MPPPIYKPFPQTLTTPRLTLTSATQADIPLRIQLLNELFSPHTSQRWTQGSIEALLKEQKRMHDEAVFEKGIEWEGVPMQTYVIQLKSVGEEMKGDEIEGEEGEGGREKGIKIGLISFSLKQSTTPPELGFSILRAHQSRGYITESIVAVLTALRDIVGVKQVCALTSDENVACQKALVKAGFVDGGWVVMDGIDVGEGRRMRAFVLEGMGRLEGEKTFFASWGVLRRWCEENEGE